MRITAPIHSKYGVLFPANCRSLPQLTKNPRSDLRIAKPNEGFELRELVTKLILSRLV